MESSIIGECPGENLPWEIMSYFTVQAGGAPPRPDRNPGHEPALAPDRAGIIGQSRAVKEVFSLIDAVAETDITVLITGETGVGKELAARALHRNSLRSHGPFIRVNCAALPESLIASELFGHEKGAFTGADQQRQGRFERAHTGTLFLDEIGDIPPAIQLQLLRVIQTREFERVGGRRTIRSDFRLVTATNKDLKKQVAAGRFREDLYYRLNVFPIPVPALRHRKEDIPLLVRHFLARSAQSLNRPLHSICPKEMDKITDHAWPGNIRELKNKVERWVILSRGGELKIPATELRSGPCHRETDLSMAEMERRHILKVLRLTKGKINGRDGAAELLQLHPSTLRFRIKKLGLAIQRNPVAV